MCICCYRAIDDLYTLAEMDGNLWQAHNIVQLLDESTTDFRQVSSCSLASRCHLHRASLQQQYVLNPASCSPCSCRPSSRAKAAVTVASMRLEHGRHGCLSPPQGNAPCPVLTQVCPTCIATHSAGLSGARHLTQPLFATACLPLTHECQKSIVVLTALGCFWVWRRAT